MPQNLTRSWIFLLVLFTAAAFPAFGQAEPPAEAQPAESSSDEAKKKSDDTEKYRLRYKFEQGKFVKYHVVDRSSFTTRKNEVAETVRNHSQQWRHYRVVSVNDEGEATLELMIDRARLAAQFGNSPPTVFDSADPDLQPQKMQSIMKSIGKALCRMTVDTSGNLVSLRSLNGDENLKHDPAINFLVIFPEEEIPVGESWNQYLTVKVPVTKRLSEDVKLIRQYRLEKVEDGIAHIHLTTAQAQVMRDPAMQTRIMTQLPAGMIKFDIERGVILSRNLSVDERVVGAFGAGSLVQAQNQRSEQLLDKTETAQKDDGAEVSRK